MPSQSAGGVPVAELQQVGEAAAQDAGVECEYLGSFLTDLASAVHTGSRLDAHALSFYAVRGDRAARAGVALRAVLDLYLSAGWRLWSQLPAVTSSDARVVAQAGQVMLHAMDDCVASLAEGYQLARRSVVREQEAARREFFDDLLAGHSDIAGLTHRAAGLGLDLAAPLAVLVVRAQRSFVDGSLLLADIERALHGRKADADALVATKDGDLVVIFAAPSAEALDFVLNRVSGVLEEQLAHEQRWRLALGRTDTGPAGVLASYGQARDALELATQLNMPERLVRGEEMLVYRLLLHDREAVGELVRTYLAPLQQARGGAAPLLQTLRVYFDAGANTALAARELHLSVRAVSYRLERIKALSGRDPGDPADRYALQTAVLGARLLGWPDP